MKMNRLMGSVAATLLLLGAAGARAQSTTAVADPAVAAQQEALSTVQATRAAVIGEIVDRWRSSLPKANPSQNIADGAVAMAAKLQLATPEVLLAASRAGSLEELNALTASSWKGPGTIVLEPGQAITNTIGSLSTDLVFTPITPCRIVDTRLATGGWFGKLGPGGAQLDNWFSVGLANFAAQGGATSCPGMPTSFKPAGIAINVTSTGQTGPGNLRVVACGAGTPTVSLLNYTAGVNLANAAVVSSASATCSLGPPAGAGPSDIYVLAGNSATDVVIDIMGYFAPPVATALSCTTVTAASGVIASGALNNTTATCATGYTVTGGGFFVGAAFSPAVFTFNSSPSGTNGWTAGVVNTQAGTISNTVYAVCCRIPGR